MNTSITSQPVPYGIAPPGSKQGVQARRKFLGDVLDICGNVRYLWMPINSETTTSTDRSVKGQTITYDATFASQYSALGSGWQASFNGSSDYGAAPDQSYMVFGDGANDNPFSVWAVVNQTATATIKTILSRYDLDTGDTRREWWFALDAAEKLYLRTYDDSAGDVYKGRTYSTALATGSPLCISGTYDGSKQNSGFKLYSAGARIDNADSTSGSYTAMEDKSSVTYLGATLSTAEAAENLFNGSMGIVLVTAQEILLTSQLALYNRARDYFNF